MTNKPLKGLKILVTRPQHQSQRLTQLIARAGGEAIVFPVIAIEAVPADLWQTRQLDNVDWLMFVSPNAVNGFCSGWQQSLPEHIRLAAVGGKGTAASMRQAGLRVDLQPLSSGSEGLLQLPEMQNMMGKHVVIVRGDGGRELLADTLAARGATISYMEVYRRALPVYDDEVKLRACQADMLMCTSMAGLDNLHQLLSGTWTTQLAKPLVVFSERIKQHAHHMGFQQVSVTADFSDDDVVTTLIEMEKQHGKQREETAD